MQKQVIFSQRSHYFRSQFFNASLNKSGLYRRFSAWVVLLIFLAGWSLGTLHRLLSHHSHEGQPECSASYDPHATHLHDETYAKEHCSLCAFVLSTPELLTITAMLTAQQAIPDEQDSFQCKPSCTGTIHDTTCLRGPPVL